MYVCMYVCMCVHFCVCVWFCVDSPKVSVTCACVHACMYVCMHVCMYVCMYVCVCLHVLCMYVSLCMYVCVCACKHVCMYVCMYVCAFVCVCVILRRLTKSFSNLCKTHQKLHQNLDSQRAGGYFRKAPTFGWKVICIKALLRNLHTAIFTKSIVGNASSLCTTCSGRSMDIESNEILFANLTRLSIHWTTPNNCMEIWSISAQKSFFQFAQTILCFGRGGLKLSSYTTCSHTKSSTHRRISEKTSSRSGPIMHHKPGSPYHALSVIADCMLRS